MIYIGKSPYRVSLLGGSSDLDWFVKENNYGLCLGFSLDKYSYSVLNLLPSNSNQGILDYSTREVYSSINEIAHPLIREVFEDLKIEKHVELKSFGFASGGSGLGGSASFLLSILAALSKGLKIDMDTSEIISKACKIEINLLNKSSGKQDQYLCSEAGINSFTFLKNNKVKKNLLSTEKIKTISRLTENFYLIPTYKSRSSDIVLSSIKDQSGSKDKIIKIREIAEKFIKFDDTRDYKIEELFHKSISESWMIKKTLSRVMNEGLAEQYEMIDKLIPNHWIRLIGAGSGGYFLISSKISNDQIKVLSNKFGIKGIFKANISKTGVESICF